VRESPRVKVVGIALVGIFAFGLSSCSSSTAQKVSISSNENKTVETVKPVFSPAEEYSYALRNSIDVLRNFWSGTEGTAMQGLDDTLKTVNVEIDESFSIVTISAESEFTPSDLSSGRWVEFTNPPNSEVRTFCIGDNYLGGDIFGTFHGQIFNEILGGEYTFTDLSRLPMPSKGFVIKMAWYQTSTSIDKFGAETTKRAYIGTDEVGVSTENLKKISDPGLADYRQLSDLIKLKYAKRSWFNGVCKEAQRANN
jgi:hypothetical protein